MRAYEYIKLTRRQIAKKICYHVLCFICLLTGMFFVLEYMAIPDQVLLMGSDHSFYTGFSRDIAIPKLEKDIAVRACRAFLERSYLHWDKKSCQVLFSKNALSDVADIVGKSAEEFKVRFIVQAVELEKTRVFQDSNQSCRVFLSGKLIRTGNYIGFSYRQLFSFRFNVKLIRSQDPTAYPMQVSKIFYEEKELYNSSHERKKI